MTVYYSIYMYYSDWLSNCEFWHFFHSVNEELWQSLPDTTSHLAPIYENGKNTFPIICGVSGNMRIKKIDHTPNVSISCSSFCCTRAKNTNFFGKWAWEKLPDVSIVPESLEHSSHSNYKPVSSNFPGELKAALDLSSFKPDVTVQRNMTTLNCCKS